MQTDNGAKSSSLLIASRLMIEIGKMTMETAKSLNPVLTMRLFPVRVRGFQKNSVDKEKMSMIMID